MLVDPDDLASDDLVESALARIQKRIQERRDAGEYPAGLEGELDRHYRQVSDTLHGTSVFLRKASDAVTRVENAGRFASERISYESKIPAGAAMHRAVGKATIRQTHGILHQLQEFAVANHEALGAILDVLRDEAVHTHPQLERRLAYLVDKLAALESIKDEMREIDARVASLEARLTAPMN